MCTSGWTCYTPPMSRAFVSPSAKLFGLFLLSIGAACSGAIPPDPYMGTIDPSGFSALYAFPTSSSNPLAACLQPRRGFVGPTGPDSLTWIYLGGLTASQLDVSNASDPARALPPSVYQVKGCNAPEGRGEKQEFDPRLDNYLRDQQYPILAQGLVPAFAGAASEPTNAATYKPWHVVVPVELQSSVADRMGCNDIKGERSLLERAGWSRETKLFPDDGPRDMDIHFPSREAIRAGTATIKDWPMVSVAVPIMKTPVPTESCPFVERNTARYPKYPGDPAASFQFPTQHWLRGLLGGYLDGGDLPVSTDPASCASIPVRVSTGKACKTAMDCNSSVGESCPAGLCMAPLPLCPKLNDLYVAVDEVFTKTDKTCSAAKPCSTSAEEYCYHGSCYAPPTGSAVQNPIPSPTTMLPDPADMTKTKPYDILSIFTAAPGQPDFSPVCRLRFFDKDKLACGRFEPDTNRPLCTADEIKSASGALAPTPKSKDFYIHCLFPKASGQ